MQTFTVYPKEGETFPIHIYKFEVSGSGEHFTLYDDSSNESYEGYLSFEDIAAIVPDGLRERQGDICFLVYLKNRAEPLKIYANAFEDAAPSLVFKRHQKDIMRRPYDEYTLDGIYIAVSEVIAVIPADGLLSHRAR